MIISRNYITKISSDKKGNVWIGTEKGLNKINIRTNEITKFWHEHNNDNTIASNSIRTLLIDSLECVWIGTSKGLSKYIGENKFETYKKSRNCENSLSNNDVTALL